MNLFAVAGSKCYLESVFYACIKGLVDFDRSGTVFFLCVKGGEGIILNNFAVRNIPQFVFQLFNFRFILLSFNNKCLFCI